MKSALIIGEALIDVVKRGPRVAEHPGGSPANVAVGLARLGRRVDLATWFGTGPRGAALRTHFKVADVHLVPGSDRAPHTSIARADLDDHGRATYTFDLSWRVPEVHLDSSVGVVHTGSIAAVLPPGADGVLEILTAAGETSTVSYDPNIRAAAMGEPTEVRPRVEALVAVSDVVKASDEDVRWLYPDVTEEETARRWAGSGPGLVVLTRGARGATAYTAAGAEVHAPAPPVEVRDTVGAGDAFTSGLLDALWEAGLLGAGARGDLRAIERATLERALSWAAHCAAITVSRAGANPPTRAEVEESLRARPE